MTDLRSNLRSLPLLALFFCPLIGHSVDWFPFGPDGGDARAFAADPRDPKHLFVGAANGWIYETHQGGKSWKRLARVGKRDDLVLDNIIIDPLNSKHIMVGAWVLGSTDGGLFASTDGGATWSNNSDLRNQSIRSLAVAPSDAKIVVAGTLKGVFRSTDSGNHWQSISPADSTEIHEVESIAIDPADPQTIYAGTWHLPWKTTDGGATWHNIKQGIIEDSDVFSIIVDPREPQIVYASACSGIYKSDNGGEKFTKIQGIPSTARRTRVLMQDPQHLGTVFAGTTEGLYRTDDAGKVWIETTGSDIIINDIYVDPSNSNHVLMATDRGGILASSDGGVSFAPANSGFSSRQVTSIISDSRRPGEIFAGVVNDKRWGGIFFSHDGGLSWMQRADGLDGRDVFSLGEAANGMFVAGTERGIYVYDASQSLWKPAGEVASLIANAKAALTPVSKVKRKASASPRRAVASPPSGSKGGRIESGVSSISRVGEDLFAVTLDGIFRASDPTKSWYKVEGPTAEPWRYVASAQTTALLASLKSLTLSTDSGKSWHMVAVPGELTQIGAVAVDDSGELWIGGREGIFLSTDNGASWTSLKGVSVSDVNSIYYDPKGARMLITANGASTLAFSIHTPDKAIKYWDTGWNLRFVRPVDGYLLGATIFDGIVLQPVMVQSK